MAYLKKKKSRPSSQYEIKLFVGLPILSEAKGNGILRYCPVVEDREFVGVDEQ